jgi:hypothetical protein
MPDDRVVRSFVEVVEGWRGKKLSVFGLEIEEEEVVVVVVVGSAYNGS